MKPGRAFTGVGSLGLFIVGILHARKLSMLQEMIRANAVKAPLDGIASGSFLIFSGEMMAIAVIAFLASRIQNGARIVLICGLLMAVDAALLLKFVGVFSGVYICAVVMAMFLAGAFFQGKEPTGS